MIQFKNGDKIFALGKLVSQESLHKVCLVKHTYGCRFYRSQNELVPLLLHTNSRCGSLKFFFFFKASSKCELLPSLPENRTLSKKNLAGIQMYQSRSMYGKKGKKKIYLKKRFVLGGYHHQSSSSSSHHNSIIHQLQKPRRQNHFWFKQRRFKPFSRRPRNLFRPS